MRSAFPGMDPYLELYWREAHQRFITSCADQLQRRLPNTLRARLEDRVYVESEGEPRRRVGPDVRAVEHRPHPSRTVELPEAEGGVAVALDVAEPVLLEYECEPIREGMIRIVDVADGKRVVSAIEFVSPTIKHPGEGRRLYLQKRGECFDGHVNFVEIDLTRSVDRYDGFLPFYAPLDLRQSYQAWARRAVRPSRYEVYPLSLREPLPAIAIPLRENDRDVPLELQKLVDLCYLNGRFDDIDYTQELPVPLPPEDAQWADALLRAAGRR